MVKVYLVGTSHEHQLAAKQPQFESFIRELCRTHNIGLVAEEMNHEAISYAKIEESIPAYVARTEGVAHIYCDPDSTERARFGIRERGRLQAEGKLYGCSDEEIRQRLDENE